jgi:hypothetical protein
MVFLASFSAISFASALIMVMNSTQHSMSKSRVSLAKVMVLPLSTGFVARTSVMIFPTVAVGNQHDALNLFAFVVEMYLWAGRGHHCL